jgi:hypothetical protein
MAVWSLNFQKASGTVQMAMDEDVPEALEYIEHSVTRMDTFLSAVLQLRALAAANWISIR